ncbi:MAG TPA: hypothetical protein VFK88_04015, partial [Gallionella sp.]|nr:hypothetical protein [Gallionella sp.]
MSTARLILTSLFVAMLGYAIQSKAEDIDLYSAVTGVSDADLPNLLFVLDNAANWNASSATTCTYADTGGSPSLGATTGGIEQCVLNNAINALPLKSDGSAVIKIGIMVYNKNGMHDLYGCNESAVGGCLMFPLAAMNASGKAALMATIKAWTADVQSNNEATGQAMQESWAYYAGSTGMSGTTYTSPALTGCAKNFVLFIGNAINNSGSPGDASGSPGNRLIDTVDHNTALTATQKTQLKATISIPAAAYGTSSFTCSPDPYSMPNHTESSGLYADEWARYMSNV